MAVVVVAMAVVEWVLWLVGCGGWVFFFLCPVVVAVGG